MHPNAPIKTTSFNVADEFKTLSLEALQAESRRRRLPFAIALANITGDLNTGVMIRTACVLGAEQVFLFGRKKYDRRSTVGAHHYIDIHHYDTITDNGQFDWVRVLDLIRVHGYTPTLIEQYGSSIISLEPTVDEPLCLVFGSEDHGIPREVCAVERTYHIEQPGILRSLNVSTAAGIAMHHVSTALRSVIS